MKTLLWIFVLVFLFFAVAGQDMPGLTCCRMLQLKMTGSTSDNQSSRSGFYKLEMETMKYRQVEGKNYLYHWRDKAWYFGVDIHTSGLQSELTMECPDKARAWRYWRVNGNQETWSDFQNVEVWLTCVNEDQMGLNLSENSFVEGEGSFPEFRNSTFPQFQYSTNDGPNVQCSTLNKNAPDYPPHPRIVLLGASGVGKSSLGNQLLGCYKKEEDCQTFSVGHTSSSHTTETFWAVGNYLGKGGCVTLVDTPGASDSEGRDYDHALDMAKVLRTDLKSVDVFLLMFNGQNPRFKGSIKKLLKLYVSIFSDDLWKHAITEITFWKWDETTVEERLEDAQTNATLKHEQWNREYHGRLGVTNEIPTVFVDPVFPIFSKDESKKKKIKRQPEAVEEFVYYTSKLWSLANEMPEFHCKDRCEAPQGYFTGTPWVLRPIVKGRLGTSQNSLCQIWKGIHGAASTKNVKWKFNGITIFKKETDIILNNSSTNITAEWEDKIKVTEEENEHFSEFQLTLHNLDKETEGIYSCENEMKSGNTPKNNVVEMLLIEDGTWSSWMPWGQCSRSCWETGDDLGIRKRKRMCNPPKNGGMPCIMSDSEDTTPCAHKRCPVDCEWSVWGPWTYGERCSKTCGGGTNLKTRYRNFETKSAGTGKQCSGYPRETYMVDCNQQDCPSGWCTAGLKGTVECHVDENHCSSGWGYKDRYDAGKARCWCQCCKGDVCGRKSW